MDKKGNPTSKDFIPDPRAVVANKTWTMGEVIDYHGFEDCFTACQKPIRIFQMMMKQNLIAVGRNQRACMEGCRDKEGAMKTECNTTCANQTTEVVQLLDKKLSDDIILNEERIFASPKLWQ